MNHDDGWLMDVAIVGALLLVFGAVMAVIL